MKINDSVKNKVDLALDKVQTDKNAGAKAAANGKSEAAKGAGDNVTLSAMSVQLQSIGANVGSTGVFDAEKVEAIKSAIASGQFKVDSEKVADSLIDTVKDLLKPTSA